MANMKIAAPLCLPTEVAPLVRAGARELYCGLLSPAWQRRYSPLASCNRRYFTKSSLPHIYALRDAVRMAKNGYWMANVRFL